MNTEIKDKNEKLLELLDEVEEVKIQVYARDKSIELQQKQIEDLLEELRDMKAIDNDIKVLIRKKAAVDEENARLKLEMEEKFKIKNKTAADENDMAEDNASKDEQIHLLKSAKQMKEKSSRHHLLSQKKKSLLPRNYSPNSRNRWQQ